MTRTLLAAVAAALAPAFAAAQTAAWSGHAGNPQHTALSPTATQPLQAIRWQTPVDLNPQYTGNGSLLIHYGSSVITAANTVVVPVKTGATDGFRVEARSGATGALLWTQDTDYTLPTSNWKPSYSSTIAPGNTLYYAGAGGTIYRRGNLDAPGAVTPTQLAFFGTGGNATDLSTYLGDRADFNANVSVSTPITSDAAGNIYFGYQVRNPSAVGDLQSGIAKITPGGAASYVPAASLAPAGDATIRGVVTNCAPALSADGSRVYVAVTTADGVTSQSGNGYLVALNTATLAVAGRADLRDAGTPTNRARLTNNGTASPTIGPDGHVYFGVLENPFASSRGWMLHFNADLTRSETPGGFGWDITPSVIPRAMVPSYQGTSEYLLMTKYNNYAGLGGDGVNKLAILDPNATQIDPRTGATVMREVLTIAGVTPDPEYTATHPNAVREWCINTAAIDPATNSVLANSADGKLYRWDLTTNTFTEVLTLTQGIGEAYTPTVIGPDGTVYAINNAVLYAVGVPVPEPTAVLGLAAVGLGLAAAARRRRCAGRGKGACR
ncbi:MAG TPA: PEP-CTERM sorting domain-containing protein [Fimbriiglobus sp.]|jgi:hypothetical protein|nr:PEP-CTERM sorting domain-containing protein [Fimbriiglobus sp.]